MDSLKLLLLYAIEPNKNSFIKCNLLHENIIQQRIQSKMITSHQYPLGVPLNLISLRLLTRFSGSSQSTFSKSWDCRISLFTGYSHLSPQLRFQFGLIEVQRGSFIAPKFCFVKVAWYLPISTLFLTMSSQVSKLLNQAADHQKFGYHPSCQAVRLTHLCFADDILVFTDGLLASLHSVLRVMEDFPRISVF